MQILDLAVYVACIAFVITQVHLALTARKLLKRNDQSWAKAQATIFEAQKVIHDDVLMIVGESPGLSGMKTAIAELGARLNGLPQVIEDRFLKLQGGLKESFISFGDSLSKDLSGLLSPKIPPAFRGGMDPTLAQSKGVEARKINQIISTLEAGAGTGGNLLGAVNDVAGLLEMFGEPGLADWLQENPDKLPQIYARVSRNPRLAQGLAKLENKILGTPPGNGSQMSSNPSRGREM